ncbi:Signal peptidase subunit [Pseudoloma neurophilia]|uniref:Signal peptidase complex subunit 1 n=1 Tax=Pseudoloma neurophilia TaxID=146866 RepID=A0A0R0M175_9MICR|nr:Signal peptidase subunit [Pseudoloma neurophilia]
MEALTKLYATCTQPIDFYGQALAKKLIYIIFFIGFTISLLIGILLNDLKYTLFLGIATAIFSVFVVVPPWPIYRRNMKEFQTKKS